MFVLERFLAERSRMLRRAHRGLPNVLKARFSPTAVWTTPGDDEPTSTTDDGLFPFLRPTTTFTPPTTRTPSTSSTPTPTPTPTTVAAPQTTSLSSISTSSSSTVIPTTSSTSSTPSTSSARTSATPTPTTTTPSSIHSTSSRTTALVTSTVSSHTSATSLGSEASASSTATSSSGITTAGAVGIAAAAIVGFIAVTSIAMFLVRRWNRKKDEYDPDEFRRQSQMLRDDSSLLQRGNSGGRGGFAPRPPTMFERHHQNIATFATPSPPPNVYQSNAYGPAYPFGDYASQQYSPFYAPGPAASPAPAQYANVSPYNMQSSTGFPASMGPYGGAAYNAQDRLARTPSNAAASVLSRNNSVAQPPYPAEEADYADLTRSSVTPYQAAQYEAISKHLNIPPPQPLQQVSEADEIDESKQAKEERPATMVSPFEDPQAGDTQQAPANNTGAVYAAARASSDSEVHAAPEPGSRITSSPPSLPEIRMMSGTFSPVALSFPVTPSPRKGSFDLHSGRASPKVDLPPLSPSSTSPQRAQFVDGVEARAHDGHETPVEIGFVGSGASKADAAPASAAKVEAPEHKAEPSKFMASKSEASASDAPKRPETVYSDDDAYGGF